MVKIKTPLAWPPGTKPKPPKPGKPAYDNPKPPKKEGEKDK